MMNPCSISRQTSKWTKNLFFHLTNPSILNSFTLLFLGFKIITPIFQTCNGQGLNTSEVKGASITDSYMGKTNPFHQSSKTALCITTAVRTSNSVSYTCTILLHLRKTGDFSLDIHCGCASE
jgi:hypothetical protein